MLPFYPPSRMEWRLYRQIHRMRKTGWYNFFFFSFFLSNFVFLYFTYSAIRDRRRLSFPISSLGFCRYRESTLKSFCSPILEQYQSHTSGLTPENLINQTNTPLVFWTPWLYCTIEKRVISSRCLQIGLSRSTSQPRTVGSVHKYHEITTTYVLTYRRPYTAIRTTSGPEYLLNKAEY